MRIESASRHARTSARRRRPAGARAGREGGAAIETALVLPVLVALVLGLIDFARLVWSQATLDYAVQAAARCGAVDSTTCGTFAQIKSYAMDKAAGLDVAADDFSVATAACGVEVTATFAFEFVVPWIDPSATTLSARACFAP